MGILSKIVSTAAQKVLIDTAVNGVIKTAVAVSEVNEKKERRRAAENIGKIKMRKCASQYHRKHYEDVKEELEAYGFVNIACLPKRDLINGKLTKDGSVANVIIAGNDSFAINQSFYFDARVVIEYHTFKKK